MSSQLEVFCKKLNLPLPELNDEQKSFLRKRETFPNQDKTSYAIESEASYLFRVFRRDLDWVNGQGEVVEAEKNNTDQKLFARWILRNCENHLSKLDSEEARVVYGQLARNLLGYLEISSLSYFSEAYGINVRDFPNLMEIVYVNLVGKKKEELEKYGLVDRNYCLYVGELYSISGLAPREENGDLGYLIPLFLKINGKLDCLSDLSLDTLQCIYGGDLLGPIISRLSAENGS